MKSLAEYQKKGFGEIIGMYLKSSWYFEKPIEKIILVALCLLGFIRLWQWIF